MSQRSADPDMRLWRAFLAANDAVTARVGAALGRQASLSVPEFQVLVRVAAGQDETMLQQELSDRLGWSDSRLSHQLRRMEERGLLLRRSAGTGRSMLVRLTASGRDALDGALPTHAIALKEYFVHPLSERDRADLMRICAKLAGPDGPDCVR